MFLECMFSYRWKTETFSSPWAKVIGLIDLNAFVNWCANNKLNKSLLIHSSENLSHIARTTKSNPIKYFLLRMYFDRISPLGNSIETIHLNSLHPLAFACVLVRRQHIQYAFDKTNDIVFRVHPLPRREQKSTEGKLLLHLNRIFD